MRWGLAVMMVTIAWIGNVHAKAQLSAVKVMQTLPTPPAEAVPEEGVGEKYLRICEAELKVRNLPASAADCEKLLERSQLIQSDAIRYILQATDKERQTFGTTPTLERYVLVEPGIDPAILVPLLIEEKETDSPRMVVQLAKDIMKSGCGYYQIDIIMRALNDAKALPLLPKLQARKSGQVPYKSCLSGVLPDGKVEECLNPIFQFATSEPSPNP